jgi:TolB-like protein/Tfp pilus assembly protein PilF
MGLVSELRRRNVLRMAALYAVAAWLIMQVAEVVVSLAELPGWSGQVVLVLLAIGFPIALILSWFYELTTEGISLERDVHPGDSITQVTGRRIDVIVISLLSAAVILFAWHAWWQSAPTDKSIAPDEAIESIAVLPLQNLSNDPDQEYFVEGMQDALITHLSRMTGLRVISKTSTFRYETTDKSIPEIARELNVDALIEGSVLRDANRVRITAKLIRGTEDEHLWANSYDRDLDDIFALINEISIAIADEIEVTVKQQDIEEWAQSSYANLKVHELVLQGNHYLDRFKLDQSLRYYQQAIDLDSEFAPAHAGVAASYVLMVFRDLIASSELIPKAREAALKAISLDRNFAGGYATLGFIQLYFDWDWEGAKTSLSRALELRPNDANVRHAYADYLIVMGDLKASVNQVEIGRLYDPLSPMANTVVGFHRVLARQYDEVIEEAQKAIAEEPELVVSLSYYHEALWLKGMYEQAFAAYKRTWGRDEDLLRAMNMGFSESGYTGAVHSLANALAGRDPEFRDYVTLASLYARAGEQELALESLENAYQHRQPQILHIRAMPVFDELSTTPAFRDLLHRIGFPEASPR